MRQPQSDREHAGAQAHDAVQARGRGRPGARRKFLEARGQHPDHFTIDAGEKNSRPVINVIMTCNTPESAWLVGSMVDAKP